MIDGKNVLSIITARAGSSLMGKNYRLLNGKPLVNWSVLASIHCPIVDLTVISSNCPYVFDAVEPLLTDKVQFIWRPAEFATATSKNEQSLRHAVEFCCERLSFNTDILLNLQPTSPIRKANLLEDAITQMYANNKKSLMTVGKHTPFFVQKLEDGSLKWHYDPFNRPMRQELKEKDLYMYDCGCLYGCTKDVLFTHNCRMDQDPYLYIIDPFSALQIDNEADFSILEKLMQEIHVTDQYVK